MADVETLSVPKTIPAMLHPVSALLNDPEVIEISLNPDGNMFVQRFGSRTMAERGCSAADAESMIRWCASGQDRIIDRTSPIVSGTVPGFAHRIEALLPPVVLAPVFSIRRHGETPIELSMFDWGTEREDEIDRMTAMINCIVSARKNMVVCGATGSGKTSFANACLAGGCEDLSRRKNRDHRGHAGAQVRTCEHRLFAQLRHHRSATTARINPAAGARSNHCRRMP